MSGYSTMQYMIRNGIDRLPMTIFLYYCIRPPGLRPVRTGVGGGGLERGT